MDKVEVCDAKVELLRRSGSFTKDGKSVDFSVLYVRIDGDVEIKLTDVDPAVKSLLNKCVKFHEVKTEVK